MDFSFFTTEREIDLTVLDDSCTTENPTASILWKLVIDNNAYGLSGMKPRIQKIEAKWDVSDDLGSAGQRTEVIENFKGGEIGKDKPNAWQLNEEIIEEFGHFYVDELIIDMNDHSVTIIYNQKDPGA